MDFVMELSGIPAAIPTKMAVMSNAIKALIFSFNTMKSSNATAKTTIIDKNMGDMVNEFIDSAGKIKIK
jgi:hypothetical protein